MLLGSTGNSCAVCTPGQHSLPETASSVTDYVSLLVQSVPSCSKVEAAQVLNEAFTVEEIEGALHKMHYGRMAGPDGLKGELFKGAYTEVPLSDGKVKHLFELSADLQIIFVCCF